MNKRGQIFLIAAIIFVMAIYSVVVEYNTIKTYPGLEDYKDLSENYQTEYPKIINFALYNSTNPVEAIDNFTQTFLQEAKKKDPNFGIFYIYKDAQGNLHIVNTLNNKVLKLELTNIKGEQITLTLLSQSTPTEGNLCIKGIGCNSVKGFVGSFDSAYYKTEVKDINRLKIEIPNSPNPLEIDLNEFNNLAYINSNQPLQLGEAGGNKEKM